MNKTVTRTAALIVLVFLLVNSAFVALNYVADSVPAEWVKHRISEAIKRHNITTDKYPLFRYGLPSIYSLIGIDQISDCLTYMHALYRDPDRLKNAIVPGYRDIRGRDHSNLCVVVKQIAFNEVPQEKLIAKYKIRLWHGGKTALLFALPKLNFFQINTMIKQITYVLYCLLAFTLFYHDKKMGITFVPVAVAGIFASGITVLGGITHSLPYLVTLLTALGLAIAPAGGGRFQILWVAAMGSVLAYFYEVDGSLMLGFGLVVFCAYFHTYGQLSNRQRWKHTVLLLLLFGGSICLSLVFKQLISFFYFDPGVVWAVFVGEIKYRIYGEYQGVGISPLVALATQFKRYYFAVLNWHAAADFLIVTGTWGWLSAITLTVLTALKHRTIGPLSDLAAFGLIGTVVLARYLIMANHSQIHTIFVSRYLFLLFGIAWAANIWFLWSTVEKKAASANSRPAARVD